MTTESRYRRLIIALGGLLVLQIAGAAIWYRWFRHDAVNSEAVVPRMQELTRERRYDEAVQLGRSTLSNTSRDDDVLQQIALVFLRRAQIEGGDKAPFTAQAVDYSEKALAANPSNPMDLYATARVLEIAGDYSVDLRCPRYKRSISLFEKRVQFLTGETMEVEGKAVPTARLRQENDYLLARIRAKMAKAGCG